MYFENYQQLADAIVIRAVQDYSNALRCRNKWHYKKPFETQVVELRKFFTSNWFYDLTGTTGECIMERLEKDPESFNCKLLGFGYNKKK